MESRREIQQVYFAETYNFCLTAELSGNTEPSVAKNVSLNLILACTRVS